MEFEGTVYKIMPVTKGTSARGEWQRQDVVFEMNEGSFARKICVTFFNKPDDVARLKEGAAYTVSVNIESREYNGRWYTDIRAWKAERPAQAGAAPMQQPYNPGVPAGVAGQNPQMPGGYNFPPQVNQAAGEPTDDLPF